MYPITSAVDDEEGENGLIADIEPREQSVEWAAWPAHKGRSGVSDEIENDRMSSRFIVFIKQGNQKMQT